MTALDHENEADAMRWEHSKKILRALLPKLKHARTMVEIHGEASAWEVLDELVGTLEFFLSGK